MLFTYSSISKDIFIECLLTSSCLLFNGYTLTYLTRRKSDSEIEVLTFKINGLHHFQKFL